MIISDFKQNEMLKCVLCHNALCSKACKKGIDPAKIIRSARFKNYDGAVDLYKCSSCETCDHPCTAACKMQVNIPEILASLDKLRPKLEGCCDCDSVDLSCDICGVKAENPFFLSSSVVGSNYEMVECAFKMGWAGVAFKTISRMDIKEASPRFAVNKNSNGDWFGFKNIEQLSDHSVEENLEIFKKLKANYPEKIIIASIMGRNEAEWEELARAVTQAGADVIECNFSCPNMEYEETGSDVGQCPELVEKYTRATRRGSDLPILAKMTPNITDMRVPARSAVAGGADGIAAINTIKSITGINLDTQTPLPAVHGASMLGGYSGDAVRPIALRFIGEMRCDDKLSGIHLSGMGGITTWTDAAEFIMMGASSLQVTTAVMQYGYRIIEDLTQGLKIFMAQRGYKNISEFVGAAAGNLVANDEIERATQLYPKFDKSKCIGCGRCYLSCRDGGHQAVCFDEDTNKVSLDPKKCVGCMLCSLVCPTGCITSGPRVPKKKI